MDSWGDVTWTTDHGWYVRRGPAPALYPNPPEGSFVFTVHRRKAKVRWVLRWRNNTDYLLFELDNRDFRRKQANGGAARELAVVHGQSGDKLVTLRIDVSKGRVTHSLWSNNTWTVLDDWQDASLDFTSGKFGFWPAAGEEIGVSNFKFTHALVTPAPPRL